MNIEQIDEQRIMISLSDKDLEGYRVTFETLSLSEIHARSVIQSLIQRAAVRTGISVDNKKITIEALKYEHGCLLLLTVENRKPPRKKYKIKNAGESYTFSFSDAESLLSCIKSLYAMNGRHIKSTVYYDGKRYYLVVSNLPILSKKYIHTIKEFSMGCRHSASSSASVAEHCMALTGSRAIESIGQHL